MTKKALRKNLQRPAGAGTDSGDERLRAFLAATADAVYSMSPDWREMRQLHGKDFIADTAEPGGDWLDKYIHPDDQSRVLAVIGKAIRDRSVFELEHRVIRADGSLGWTFSRAIPLLDAAGEIVEWLGTAKDVTERRQAEERLRQREAQLETELADITLLQSISIEFLRQDDIEILYEKIIDGAVAIMRSDFASMQMLYPERGGGGELRLLASRGFSPEAMKFWEWVSRDSSGSCGAALNSGQRVIVADSEQCDFMTGTEDLAMFRQTGIRAVQTTPLFSRSGKILGMISTHWRRPHQPSGRELRLLDILARQAADLIERKQSETALRRSEERFRAIVSQATAGVAQSDLCGGFVLMNERYCAITGYTREELLRLRMRDIIHPDDLPGNLAQFERLLNTGEDFVIEERYLRKDGSAVWVNNSVSTIRDDKGILQGVLTVSLDITERKQAEQALRESEARYRNIFQTAHVSIWEEDFSAVKRELDKLKASGIRDFRDYFAGHPEFVQRMIACVRTVGVNDTTLRMFGAKDGQELLNSLTAIFVPETTSIFIEELLAIAEEREFFEADAVLKTVQGERLHVQVTITFPPPQDSFERVLVTVMDITERKQLEEETRRLAQRLQLITDALPALISYVDADQRYRFNNKAYQDWFGYAPEEICGKSVQEVVGAEAYVRVRSRIETVLAGRHIRFEEEIPYKKVGRRIVIAEYVPDIRSDGSVAGFYGLIHDITERKELEEKTRRLAERLQLIADAMPALISYIDADHRYRFVNKAYQEWFGYMPEEVLGKSMPEVLGANAYAQVRPHVDAALGGRSIRFEAEMPYRAGGTRSILGEYVPDIRLDGSIPGIYVLVQDITERKRAERALESHAEEIERSRDMLRDADRRKDEFLATLAHELRNPLAPIRQAAKLLKSPQLGERDAQWARDVIDRQVNAMGWLLDDLLDISRISRGKLELRMEAVDLASVVESALELSRPLIDAKRHRLQVELPAATVWLEADPLRLAQVISNLLTNAAKYTDPQGELRLWARPEDAELLIGVTDNGIGIAADMLPKIFDMFSQVAPALERTEGGLGVGLALVRGLVALHGGSVEAHSGGSGRGSEFRLRLPLGDVALRKPELQAETPAAQPAVRRKVLIVDDNRDTAETLAILIRLQGYEVRTSFNGRDGLEAAETFHPDIALLDIGMPELNGYEMARHIRERLWGRRMTLIAVTGWGQEDDRRRAIAAGFDYHLRKPVDTDFLQALLKEQRPDYIRGG